jgi:hypothetical protein
MTRAAAAGIAVAALIAAFTAVPARAADPARLTLADARALPLEYFQGTTHDASGARWFAGITEGLYRTDRNLRERARLPLALPAAVTATFGFNHIGDLTFDRSEGGRLVLPLECFTPSAPNGGNTCGQGGFGVADPRTLAWRYGVLLDPVDIAKAMWAETSPDGALVWTSSGPGLLAYRSADISAANAAAGVRIRPAARLPGAVPPSGVTGAAFLRGRLLLAGQARGPLELWSVDVRSGARRCEAVLRVSGESEGLDVVDDGRGLVHWIVTPFDPRGRTPTYGTSELLSFVPALDARLRVRATARAGTVTARVTLRFSGRTRPVRGALVRAAGRTARTNAHGVARLRVGRRPAAARAVHVSATKQDLRAGSATVVVG